MTSPPREIRVRCPKCGHIYDDWYRPSLNFAIEDFEDEYVRGAARSQAAGNGTPARRATCGCSLSRSGGSTRGAQAPPT
jgi:hypothetical protein